MPAILSEKTGATMRHRKARRKLANDRIAHGPAVVPRESEASRYAGAVVRLIAAGVDWIIRLCG